jgi:hypothetical protein
MRSNSIPASQLFRERPDVCRQALRRFAEQRRSLLVRAHDLPWGAKTWDAIDQAIRLRDKLLLILSKAAIASEWVEDEVNKAYAEERSRKEVVLFPICIDGTVMCTDEPWAVKLHDQRNIGDFRQWKNPARYQKSLERLLRDLKASGAE